MIILKIDNQLNPNSWTTWIIRTPLGQVFRSYYASHLYPSGKIRVG